MINSIISFKNIPFKIYKSDTLLPKESIISKDNNQKDVFVSVKPTKDDCSFKTLVKDKNKRIIAENNFSINHNQSKINNAGMEVLKKEEKGKGYGIVMHLMSVVELMENNLDRIELNSMPQAILFHGKCKFKPQINDCYDSESVMLQISQKNCVEIPELAQPVKRAGELFDKMYFSNTFNFSWNEDIKSVNEIADEYIQTLAAHKLTKSQKSSYALKNVIPMVLTKENIIQNKNFYNNLFKKYNIDYQII